METKKNEVMDLAVSEISVVYNPRKKFDAKRLNELTASVKANGVLQRLLVRFEPAGDDLAVGRYVLIAGERRLRAARAAGLDVVPVEVLSVDAKGAAEIALVENLQRADLDVLEEADGFHELMKYGWGVPEMVERFGFKKDYIYIRLEFRKLDADVKGAVASGDVTLKVAKVLGRITNEDVRSKALDEVVHPKFSETPLVQDKALSLLKREYIEPQQAEAKWEERRGKLEKQYEGSDVVPYAERGEYLESYEWLGANDMVPLDEQCSVYGSECGDLTWLEVAKFYKVLGKVVCGEGGEPEVYFSRELIELADAENAGDDYFLARKKVYSQMTDEEKLAHERAKMAEENDAEMLVKRKAVAWRGLLDADVGSLKLSDAVSVSVLRRADELAGKFVWSEQCAVFCGLEVEGVVLGSKEVEYAYEVIENEMAVHGGARLLMCFLLAEMEYADEVYDGLFRHGWDKVDLEAEFSEEVIARAVEMTAPMAEVTVEKVQQSCGWSYEKAAGVYAVMGARGYLELGDVSDTLVNQCIEVVQQEKKVSTSLLQRRLRLGYTRAAKVMVVLEDRGIIGSADGANAREVLIDVEGGADE